MVFCPGERGVSAPARPARGTPMRRNHLLALTLLAVGVSLPATAVAQDKAVQVTGIAIHKRLPKDQQDVILAYQFGTTVDVLITQKDKRILGVDTKASKLTSFADDKKTDLSKPPKQDEFVYVEPWLGFAKAISKDGQRI